MRILSRLPERRGTAPLPSGPLARKRIEPLRTAPTRTPRQVPDALAPARGIAVALGLGTAAWVAMLLTLVR